MRRSDMKFLDYPSLARRGATSIVVFLLSATVAHGATYYVRADGNNGNDGLSNSPGGAWLTVDWAADHVQAGDTVRIQQGTYPEIVSQTRNGSAGATITFVGDGAATVCGWTFNNNSYVRLVGLVLDSNAGGCTARDRVVSLLGTNTYLEFWHNTVRDGGDGIGMSQLTDRFNSSVMIGNTLTDLGTSRAFGFCASAVVTQGTHSLMAYNNIGPIDCDGFAVNGTHNRWINNYLHDIRETSGGHSDFFQFGSHPLGLSWNIIEANFQAGVGNTSDEHTAIFQNYDSARCGSNPCPTPVTENLWRRNVWHNVSSGSMGIAYAASGTMTFNRHYNNTTAGANRISPTTNAGHYWYNGVSNTYVFNNIEYKIWGDSVTNAQVYYADSTFTADYNLAYTPDRTMAFSAPWTSQPHARSNVNPGLVDYNNDNFTLSASSGAIGAGGPLTTTAGSGSGTTFNVASGTGGFFRGPDTSLPQYGGNLTAGDVITVGTTVVTVASVSGDTITVTTPFSWSSGAPVFIGNDATPDIGAYPYKSGGFNLSAGYSQSGGTVTVTPSDPSLVRFVVCFDDGVPTTVDNVGPYTCPVGQGAFSARVYPLYAGKTLFVNATSGGGGASSSSEPMAPTNLRILAGQ
jgi:hypothetical protein